MKLCECGCGQPVKRKKRRFVDWHGNKNQAGPQPYQQSSGRWVVKCRDGTKVYWYRIVMRNKLNRELLPGEVVDHINGDKTDDRLKNLRLFSSQSAHMKMERRRKKALK